MVKVEVKKELEWQDTYITSPTKLLFFVWLDFKASYYDF
jgi:hypothetical protein